MKKIFRILSVSFALLSIISCSNLNENSSLSLTFNGSDFARASSSRNVLVNSDYENYYIVMSILGDYSETKTIQISEAQSQTITFDHVPVGAKIYVEANVYEPNATQTPGSNFPLTLHKFTGKSEKQIVRSGTNYLNLVLKNIANIYPADSTTINSTNNYNLNPSTYNGKMIWTSFSLNFYSNGKYIITVSDNIISEGLYSGTPEPGNTVIFKEYIYKTVSSTTESNEALDLTFGNMVLVENPKNYSVNLGDANSNFEFRTGSNICIVFNNP